jgi:signal recognition particle subunit SRP68
MNRGTRMACDTMTLLVIGSYNTIFSWAFDLYNMCRKHCANRTHRLRSSLKMTHGKGRDFKKLPPLNPDIIKDGQ